MDETKLTSYQRDALAKLRAGPPPGSRARARVLAQPLLAGAHADLVAVDDPPPAPPSVDHQALFERCVRREAPFAGLYVLANVERTRWALPYLIARLRAGGPLATRLEFVEART